ncbi:putative disease resistance protein RGA1 isoform X6 [Malus sylvestris]|uniref:putative disease resistance protein RGA1 isoform X6 n=1 Tax=Malus sylvestris TaxID=3752 RepID=UPI0021ABCEE9|nr:putative disease resistance protein RGA1 isoform X6 [Malus sylvestris]XP_050110395.1 putative disease resistance protein RGA1 isoform X6 [Malus sylvestris]XP_050110396.1 putative disease resistance protein RGA1 isoform X6 [Malus sylvestris]XP_050110397.1 putative disease resistance protein RGA1 isoform X6 [Malus sylvestris]XP_050110398.1 putative disease resistance protein RGA1 isoform X6 [Malus sylvestris]XP_050110399.1 putative disease resistance protein RGA1 isoform X6 [Malus sylvestris]
MAAEVVLTFAAEGILKKVLSLAQKEFKFAWGFKAELEKLKESFTKIELLLNSVADKPQDPPIEAWVKKLKDVAHDAEDVLDELEYEGYRRKVEIQNHMKKKVLNFFSLSNPLAFRLQMAPKFQKINASLVDLKSEASLLGLVSKNKDATSQGIRWDRQTNSLIGKDEKTFGRGKAVSNIVTNLTNSKNNQENLAVMAIVGMGGLGKTTLAKSVYNEDSIHKFFEKRIWVCVSNTFDVTLILHRMLESLTLTNASSKDNQDAILKKLQEELKDKRYLLVLDDVWNEDARNWEYLMECLSKLNSAGGSKIIVTTRSGKVASISEKLLPRHELGKLSVDECWSIMKDRAFPDSSALEFDSSAPEFEAIGKEIAKNCGGIPLMAKVLGGILHNKKSTQEWSSFKNSRIWNNHSKEEDRIMSILRLSFDNLESPSLKQCFAYCSMFEKDAEIQRDNLIQLWMAQGLLRSSLGGSKDMEDIGNEYFDILLQSSLFQDATISDNGIVSECKMHDLVHDLAEHLSESEGLTRDLCGVDNTHEIRHVARASTSTLEKIPERSARKLWSLFSDNGEVPTNILPRFKALRVLNLSKANIEEFPVLVGRLKHLRYLDISGTRFKALPKSIGKLYNLQTLRAKNCTLKEFPKELQNLINLRHIYFDWNIKFPQGIGRLTCLRTLPYFSVGNEIGRRIEELAGLKQLKGELIVSNLQLVKNGEEAKKAKLEDKTKIRHLSFNWTEDRSTTDNNEDEDVLEGLRPHLELESLSIANFMGDKFPTWMMSGSLMPNKLKKIELLGCDKCEGVPPLGHLPSLTELKIRGMANLKCVGAEFYGYDLVHNVATTSEEVITLFPALKVLYISKCGDLNEWKQAPTTSRKKVVVFPSLEMLTIEDCSKLRNAPSHFPFLQKLEMSSCDSRTPIEEISSGLTTLTFLKIKGIKELTCLPQGILKKNNKLSSLDISDCNDLTCITQDVVGSCSSLERLCIWSCKKLRHLPNGLDTLPLLEVLEISECPSLEFIPITQSMASLQEIKIVDCGRLSRLPSGLKNCTSLQKLSIQKCNGLSGPLSLRASLVELSIWSCDNLTSIEMKGSMSLTASLQKLTIWDCRELTSLPALPQQCPSLQELMINDCPKLSWFGVKSRRVEEEEEEECISLGQLWIWSCPKLASFCAQNSRIDEEECISLQSTSDLRIMTSLRQLEISYCERLESWVSSLQFPLSLETLSIVKIPNLQILPSLDHLNSLRYLEIGGFWEELDSFPDFQVGSLMHLECLRLSGWPKLKSLPQQIQHLTSLSYLIIVNFEGVETLPEWLGSLTSLTDLLIFHCKNLMNLPSVQAMQRLTKLQILRIVRCHPLLVERCRRGSGTDWPKISHIPDIMIGNF